MSSSLPSALAFLLLLAPAQAVQTGVDFTGTWTMVPDRSESPQQTPPIKSLIYTITNSATELNLKSDRDGSDSFAKFVIGPPARAGAATTVDAGTARAYWDGPRLVTERAGTVQGETVSIKQILGLNADASEMTVETLVIVQHGYTLRGAKNYASKTDVFVRAR